MIGVRVIQLSINSYWYWCSRSYDLMLMTTQFEVSLGAMNQSLSLFLAF